MAESLDDIQRKILAREVELDEEEDKGGRRLLRAELVQLREKENMLLRQQEGAAGGSGQVGVGAGAGASPAFMPQAEYLQRPMEDIKYNAGPTASGSCTDSVTYELSEWQLDNADINDVLATSLSGKTIARPEATHWQPSGTTFSSEAQTNNLFFRSACHWINEVYAANGIQLDWKLAPSSDDNLLPDFVFGPRGARDKAEVMVGEGKFPSELDQADLLEAVEAVRHHKRQGTTLPRGLRQSLCCAVEQECGYMEGRRRRYGFLTCHRYTYFLKYMGPKQYAITGAFLAAATNPSVAAILYYLCEKSREEGLVKDQGPSAAKIMAPAGGSSSAAAGRGADRPAKQARSETAGSRQGRGAQSEKQRSADAPAGATCSITPCMIPDGALRLEGRLGQGLCGIVFLARLFGQEVALKCVDAYNSPHLIPHLQHDAHVLSGRLQRLQGICVPSLRAYGYWKGRLMFALATSVIYGRHPEAGQESASAKASAEKALREIHAQGVAHGDIREENILVDGDDKVWFIDFGSSVVDPAMDVCTKEFQELRLIFTASSSPDSDKTAHKHQ